MANPSQDSLTILKRNRAIGGVVLLTMLVFIPTTLLVIVFRFDGLYGQDAYAYFGYAMGPLREAIRSFEPPPPFFWPPGYPLLVATSSLILGTSPWVGQFVSVVSAAAVPIGVYLLVCELRLTSEVKTLSPWLAAVLTGLCGMLWRAGMVTMSDAAGVAFVTFGVWATVRYCRTIDVSPARGAAWCMLAATLLGTAAMTRVVYGLVLLPCALYMGVTWFTQRKGTPWWPILLAGIWYAFLTAPLWRPLLLESTQNVGFGGSFQVHEWNPLNTFRASFEGVDGVRQYRFANWFFYAITFAREFFFTPLLAPFLFVGAWRVIRHQPLRVNLLILGWPLLLYAFFVGDEYQNSRFVLAALPPIAILVALGFQDTRERLKPTWRRGLNAWLTIGIVAMVVGGTSYVSRIVDRKNQDVATVRWALAMIPTEAQIMTFGLTQTFEYETQLPVHDLYVLTQSDLSSVLEERATYVILDLANIEQQWTNHAPGQNYRWLQDTYTLTAVGQHRGFVLLRVERPPISP